MNNLTLLEIKQNAAKEYLNDILTVRINALQSTIKGCGDNAPEALKSMEYAIRELQFIQDNAQNWGFLENLS